MAAPVVSNVCRPRPPAAIPSGLCVREFGHLCHPCTESKECKALGHPDAFCIDQGDGGAFCGNRCNAAADCPANYDCQASTSVEGANGKQCVRKPAPGASEKYGVCPCTPAAIKQKMQTTCTLHYKDGKGEIIASCKGTRSCLPNGLGACAAEAVGKEVCDGKDNDCDGDLDEGACEDGNGCTADLCDGQTGKCDSTPAPNGSTCDADGSACTDADACQSGKCKAGAPLNCNDTNPCTKDSCDAKGGCSHSYNNGVSCSDDNPCTIGDKCKEGSCDSGKPKKCSSPDVCTLSKCSVKDGKCKFEDALNGLPCDDGNQCTEGDACKGGSCKAGSLSNCDDANPCTTDQCQGAKGCTNVANTKPCDADGSKCTAGDKCKAKVCVVGPAKNCDDKNPCTSDSCNKANGLCVFDGKGHNGDPCDDGKGCTQKDTCTNGKCAGKNASCDDNNPCTADKCDLAAGKCVYDAKPFAGKACDDGEACTNGDKCTAGKCAGVGKVCNDGNPCTVDTCNVAKGACSYDSNALSGKACEDGNACTKLDKCTSGKCVGSMVVCNDNNACTKDICDSQAGKCLYATSAMNGAACNDGNKCTISDKCTLGKCNGAPLKCDDGKPCTVDTCSAVSGCAHKTASDKTTCSADGKKWCAAGKCIAKCQSTCAKIGDKQCGAGGVQTCGDANKDGCFEWGAATSCENWQICKLGKCVQKQAPHVIVINEVLYDSPGVDSDVFIELRGPKGATVNGWSLVGIDGKGGKTYNVISLKGNIPADGLFLVAGTKAAKWISDHADQTSSAADYQNGPDNIQLRYGSVVVDAVGYGSFGGMIFKGEGKPAPDPGAGISIGRDASGTDTDDNSKDFTAWASPSPGKANVTANQPPEAKLSCPGSGKVGQTLLLDGSGSNDPDGKIATYAFAFGDGSPLVKGAANKVQHAWKKSGTFTVQLTVVDDKGDSDSTTCKVSIGAANKPPVAKLACPATAKPGVAVTIDGSGSSDADGKITTYAFDFGDGSAVVKGGVAKVSHAFKKTGSVQVSLTVTDDKKATNSTTCNVAVQKADPPVVLFVKPQQGTPVTQGEKVAFLVDATPKGGKSIKSVLVEAGGKSIGTDTTAPYTFAWTVPTAAKTGSTVSFVAKATDSGGGIGASTPLQLNIVNDKPKAAFTAIVAGALQVDLDASLCSDTETAKAKLQVRWDWENDGKWDTPFSTTKVVKKQYAKAGTYTIKVQVKDAVGQVAETTRTVNLALIQQVSGTIKTTTWVGTIIVTGDIIVPKGQVLTIAKGTSVQFVATDQNKDGYGDYNIYVYGKLNVVGTADQPVVFTVYGAKKEVGKAWQRIQLKGEGSAIAHAVIEYARWGIEALDKSTIANTTLRYNRQGIRASTGASVVASKLKVTQNIEAGVYATSNANLTFTEGQFINNGHQGIYMFGTGSTVKLNLTGATVQGNKLTGLHIRGRVAGKISKNQILANDWEGVRIEPYKTYDPTVVVNYNNITDNAQVGARVTANLGASASKSGSGSGTSSSAAKGVPGGHKISLIRYSYSESDKYGYVSGRARKSTSGGTTLGSWSSSSKGWIDVHSSSVTKVVAQVQKNTSSSSYNGYLSLTTAAYDLKGAKREVSVVTRTATVDLRHNYYGVFPDVLPKLTLSQYSAANIHGFVGVKFDSKWSKANYYGGETLTKDTAWSGTIWLTGDLVVGSGKTLTINDGAQVHVVYLDQNGDKKGDFDIIATGRILSKGTSAKGVLIHGYGAGQKVAKGWDRIRLNGSGSSFVHTLIEHAYTGLYVANSASASNLTVRNNEHGFIVYSGGKFTVANSTLIANAQHGGWISNGGQLTLKTSLVTGNGNSGIYSRVTSSSTKLTATDNTFSANKRLGLELLGGLVATIKHNQVTGNDSEGVRLAHASGYDPTITMQFNNIWGNAKVRARVISTLSLSASKSGSGSGTSTSVAKGTPGGQYIDMLQYKYSESDKYGYVSGRVRKDSSGGSTLVSMSSSTSGWKEVLSSKAKKVVAQVQKNTSSSSYNGYLNVPQIVYDAAGAKREVTVVTRTKTLDLRHNWFGTFPAILPVLTLSHPAAANLHGFVGKKFGSTWSKGPYKGGESLAASTTWSGIVWMTGDYTVPTGKTLTIAAGTQVRFVAHDQDKNGHGDFDITVNGVLNATGKAASKVLFTVEGDANKKKNAWERIYGYGSSAKLLLTHTDVAWGHDCLYLKAGAHSVKSSTVHDCGGHGLQAYSASGVTLSDIVSKDHSGHGLYIRVSKSVSLATATLSGNAGHGIYVESSTSSINLSNFTATKNTDAGIRLYASSPAISSCNLSYNKLGIRYERNSAGTLKLCDIKYNDQEGVLLLSHSGLNPSPKINSNNIFGNSNKLGGVIDNFNLSASKSGSGSGTATAPKPPAPAKGVSGGYQMPYLRMKYSESDKYGYVSGRVRKDSSAGSTIFSASSSSSLRWKDVRSYKVTKVVAQVQKNTSSSSYSGYMTVSQAFYRKPKQARELVALTDSYKVNCTANYWGVFPDVLPLLALSRTDAVDFSGMKLLAIGGTGPQ